MSTQCLNNIMNPTKRQTAFNRNRIYIPLFFWIGIHLYISLTRSFWQDEIMRYMQMQMPFLEGLKSLIKEPSPFAPGELILAYLCRFIFGSWTPIEFWGRVPSVYWGALTLWLSLRMGSKMLPYLIFLSVSLTSFSTQFRPYAALVFAGALASYLILKPSHNFKNTRFEKVLFWSTLLLTHLYGIAFLGLASFLNKQWVRAFISILFIFCIGMVYLSFHGGHVGDWPDQNLHFDWFEVIKLTLQTLGNAYRPWLFVIPFLVGSALLLRLSFELFLKIQTLFIATLVFPQIANMMGNYNYAQRQMVAGIFPFLFIVSVGIDWILLKLNKLNFIKKTFEIGLILLALRAWSLFVFSGTPPFVEQPLHRYKQKIEQSILSKDKNILLLDPGGTGFFYFTLLKGDPEFRKQVKLGKYLFHKSCWSDGYCVSHFDEAEFAWKGLKGLSDSKEFEVFVNQANPKFDRILFNSYLFHMKTDVPLVRTW